MTQIGTIKKDSKEYPLYKIFYDTFTLGWRDLNLYFIGYLDDNRFYYFQESREKSGYINQLFDLYFTQSVYALPDAIHDFEIINIPGSQDFFVSAHNESYLCPDDYSKYQLFSEKHFRMYDLISVSGKESPFLAKDRYGQCQEYYYVADYFDEKESFDNPLVRLNLYLGSIFFDRLVPGILQETTESMYDPRWHYNTCHSLNIGYRILPSKDKKYLQKIGETSTERDVFIYSQSMPLPDTDIQLYYFHRNSKYGEIITEEEWTNFLENQEKNGFPVLIIENAFGENIIFVQEDYVYDGPC